jgi:hypothetical protein
MSMEPLWQKHGGRRICILNINVQKKNANVTRSSNEKITFLASMTQPLNMASFKKLKKMNNCMNLKEMSLHHCVKPALKANIKRHLFLKMKPLKLPNF